MQTVKEKEIKEQINKLIKIYVYKPQDVYIKKITKNEIDLCVVEGDKVTKLSCRIWQDNYYNHLVERAKLDLYIYTIGGEGEHICMGSQYDPIIDEKHLEKGIIRQEPKEYMLIEKAISSFYEIAEYYKKIKKLEKESPDISPGSPKCELEHEFFNKEWEI